MQTSETALLFLQVIMRRLRRKTGTKKAGRAAVVVPDGILSQEGVASRVRQHLVENFNLRYVIKLPRGVFEPYTKSSTSVLFFDADGVTDKVWFYGVPVREDVKAYSLTRPFRFEEMLPVLEWMRLPVQSDRSWIVDRDALRSSEYSLVQQNPKYAGGLHYADPTSSFADVRQRAEVLADIITNDSKVWAELDQAIEQAKRYPIGDFLRQVKREVILSDDEDYRVLGMSWYAKGLYVKHVKSGAEIKAEKLYRIEEGDFVYNRLFAWKGSFAEAGPEVADCVVSGEFPTFEVIDDRIQPGYLWAYFAQPKLWDFIEALSTGTTSTSRLRLKEVRFNRFSVPLPSTEVQDALAGLWQSALAVEKSLNALMEAHGQIVPGVLSGSCRGLRKTSDERVLTR